MFTKTCATGNNFIVHKALQLSHVMVARSRKYLCSVPSPVPPSCNRGISLKPIATTEESCENRKAVEESSNGEHRASLEQIGVNFPPVFFLFPLNFLKVLDHCLRKRKTKLGERPGWYNRLVPVLTDVALCKGQDCQSPVIHKRETCRRG